MIRSRTFWPQKPDLHSAHYSLNAVLLYYTSVSHSTGWEHSCFLQQQKLGSVLPACNTRDRLHRHCKCLPSALRQWSLPGSVVSFGRRQLPPPSCRASAPYTETRLRAVAFERLRVRSEYFLTRFLHFPRCHYVK